MSRIYCYLQEEVINCKRKTCGGCDNPQPLDKYCCSNCHYSCVHYADRKILCVPHKNYKKKEQKNEML
jgi:hypothetical protein